MEPSNSTAGALRASGCRFCTSPSFVSEVNGSWSWESVPMHMETHFAFLEQGARIHADLPSEVA